MGNPYFGCTVLFAVAMSTTVGILVGGIAPNQIGWQALLYFEAVSPLVGPGHDRACFLASEVPGLMLNSW